MNRKKIAAVVVLLCAVLALGVAFGRSNSLVSKSRPSHTIVYRITSFNGDGSIRETSQMTRHRYSDGSWKSRQTFANGKTKDAGGESVNVNRNWDEFSKGLQQENVLRFPVVVQPTEIGEVWLSPDLDDVLKLVYYFDSQKKGIESVMEAIQIEESEPPQLH
jgi:hypothetical protein